MDQHDNQNKYRFSLLDIPFPIKKEQMVEKKSKILNGQCCVINFRSQQNALHDVCLHSVKDSHPTSEFIYILLPRFHSRKANNSNLPSLYGQK